MSSSRIHVCLKFSSVLGLAPLPRFFLTSGFSVLQLNASLLSLLLQVSVLSVSSSSFDVFAYSIIGFWLYPQLLENVINDCQDYLLVAHRVMPSSMFIKRSSFLTNQK